MTGIPYPPVIRRALEALDERDRTKITEALHGTTSSRDLSFIFGVLGQKVGPTAIKDWRRNSAHWKEVTGGKPDPR